MDKKGQSAVIFIILIPVFLIITAIVVDMGINSYNEKKLKNVTEDVLEVLVESEKLEVEELKKSAVRIYEDNDIGCEYLYIEVLYDNKIKISNNYVYYSFMNSLFNRGNGNRQINVEAIGYKDNDKLVIEFEGEDYENK